MAIDTGRYSFSGTGTKTINTTSTFTPTWCMLILADSGSANVSTGTCDGTRQNYQSGNAGSAGGKILFLKNSAGTTLADVTWSSFGFAGGVGTVTFSVTTDSGTSFTLLVGN